ncbi:MAG: heavy metal translocating P-type ATPase, partial [Ahrensia sp.]
MAADAVQSGACSTGFTKAEELLHAGRTLPDGTVQYVFAVPDIHCGQCIATIERTLKPMEGVADARVNLSMRRLTVQLDTSLISASDIAAKLDALSFPATPVDIGDLDDLAKKRNDTALLKALAVAGFASANIMLLSVSVWSGADGATRDLFHLISALIAIPAVLYAGRVFYASAFNALRAGRVNMDVPIALAITLATGMSLFESVTGGEKAYFEASTMLLFFLLIGRYLDQRMRERVRNAVVQLSRFSAKGATVIDENGHQSYRPLDEIKPGMTVRLLAGDRLPADGEVLSGQCDIDRSLVSGESMPVRAQKGLALESGVLAINGMVDITITQSPEKSFLAEVQSMMEAAENGRGAYVRIADRMARAYA